MRRFRYAAEPLCLLSCVAYGVNRWVLPLAWKGAFLRGHFADLWLIPAALPPWLWVERRLGLRLHDQPPGWSEITWHLLVWTLAAEGVAPLLFPQATGDLRDAAAYAAGALVAGLVWQRP